MTSLASLSQQGARDNRHPFEPGGPNLDDRRTDEGFTEATHNDDRQTQVSEADRLSHSDIPSFDGRRSSEGTLEDLRYNDHERSERDAQVSEHSRDDAR